MMSILFSFRGRIGRLPYFLSVLGVGACLLVFIIAALASVLSHRPGGGLASIIPAIGFGLLLAPVWFWISLALQAKRFRDMGWEPTFVIPAWIIGGIIDQLAAMGAPSIAIGPLHHQTIVGVALNLILTGCLFFWPSRSLDAEGAFDDVFGKVPNGSQPASAATLPLTRPTVAGGGFGRRGR